MLSISLWVTSMPWGTAVPTWRDPCPRWHRSVMGVPYPQPTLRNTGTMYHCSCPMLETAHNTSQQATTAR